MRAHVFYIGGMKNATRTDAREALLAEARTGHLHIDTAIGPLCVLCAEVSIDMDAEWEGVAATAHCLNCEGTR